TTPLLKLIETLPGAVHSLSHVTGGGIAANLARVLPQGSWAEVDRSTWTPSPVFQVLADIAGSPIVDTEGTWNLGIGFLAVVAAEQKDAAIAAIGSQGIAAWQVATVHTGARPEGHFEEGAKGVDGGAVRLVGAYADGAK
ncbi:MAG: AIR synthase-related protein, partial [Actinomycetota bacterium]|nr:AIR synthase-related protein [Actinomycetota bacterium]